MLHHVAIYAAIAAITGAVAAVVWLVLGRRIAVVADLCFPQAGLAQPTSPMHIEFDPAGISSRFTLGPRIWLMSWPTAPGPSKIGIVTDRQGRLVICVDRGSFAFGPVQKCWDDMGKPNYEFAPEVGDVVLFTRETGRLAWPTPFSFNLLGGATPKWKRFAYDRLRWSKSSGAVLKVVWRNQEWFYPGPGWVDTYDNRLGRVIIKRAPIEEAAAAYLARTRCWNGSEYRLETCSGEQNDLIVRAIHFEDESARQPGAGKSIVLHVDRVSGKVVSESAFQ
jgi:hypothetical protein